MVVSFLCVGSGGGVDVFFVRTGLAFCEVVSMVVRVVSVWFRMFCNIVGGHVVCDGMLICVWFGVSGICVFLSGCGFFIATGLIGVIVLMV